MDQLEASNHPRVMSEAQARIHKLAIARLIAIEKEIEEKHHRKLMSSIELEFNYREAGGKLPAAPIKLDKYNDTSSGEFEKNSANSWINAPFVQVLETDGYEEQQCYEFKINPKRYIDSFELKGKRVPELYKLYAPHMVARATQSIRAHTQKKVPELFPGHQAQFMASDPVVGTETADIHVNLSVWDKEYKVSKQDEVIPRANLDMQRLLFPLVVESENSLHRFASHKSVAAAFYKIAGEEKSGNSLGIRAENSARFNRIEDRLSGADADPALSTLITVCGVYWALKHGHKPVPLDESIKDTMKIPNETEEYGVFLSAFEKSEVAKELLGDELHQAITELRTSQYQEMCDRQPHNMVQKSKLLGRLAGNEIMK